MCGIAGVVALGRSTVDKRPTMEQVRKMCDSMVHRGPDDAGYFVQDAVALGMRRLSIIDADGGQQPISNETGTVVTVFNGEIYNFVELRETLRAQGHVFATASDTETIVHAYEAYGAEFPKYLKGMFAIALYDIEKEKLFLVRDRLGVKPLYYACTGEHLVFGSEVKALLASRLVEYQLDTSALAEFLAWEYVPGEATLFKQIRKLRPGIQLELDLSGDRWVVESKTFWDIPDRSEERGVSAAEWEERVAAQLKRSVQQQQISDVPVGAFLSGGVDSSLIVSHMADAKTFSIGFEDPSYNELGWARKVADYLGVEHVSEVIEPQAVDLFEQLMAFMDDPIGDFSIFPTYLVSKLAREQVKVALSGDGGDELFGGYETYLADGKAAQYHRLPKVLRAQGVERLVRSLRPQVKKKGWVNKAKRFVEGLEHPAALSHTRWRLFAGDAIQAELLTPEAAQVGKSVNRHVVDLFEAAGDREPLNRSLYVDVKSYLCDNILTKVDRMSMAVSLEARVPFLDSDLVELAFRIPTEHKVHRGKTKVLLKAIAAKSLPSDCVYRPKEGFSIPIKQWLNAQFRPVLEEYLSLDEIKRQGIFRVSTIKRLKREHLHGYANHSHILWSLIVFQAWYRRWFEGER